jgi:hypothetical protein
MSKNNKSNLIIIPILLATSIAIVFSGCIHKQPTQQKNINKYQQQENQDIATTSPQNTEADTTTNTTKNKINTGNWKVYRNKEYGFEIKYPKRWIIKKLSDSKAGFVVSSPDYVPITRYNIIYQGEFYINKISNPHRLNIITLIKTFDDTSKFWPERFPYKKIIVNGYEAIEFSNINNERQVVFIANNNNGYVLVLSYCYDKINKQTAQIFEQLVNSVKFIKTEKMKK